MRQAGIIAAGALYAINHQHDRLADDHEHAKMLGSTIAKLPGVHIDIETVETNLVTFETDGPAMELVEKLDKAGVKVLATGPNTIRAVTHLDISSQDIEETCEIFTRILTTV